jgi:hypothetical protein
MKTNFKFQQLLPAALLAALLTACSPSQEGSQDAGRPTQTALQGEPIKPLAPAAESPRGEPITSLAATERGDAEPARPVETAATVTDEVAETPAPVAAATEAAAADSPVETIRSGNRDYLSIGFNQLAAFNFEMTDDLLEAKGDPEELAEKTNGQIPESIRKLNEQSVAVKGYMLPLKVVEGAVTEFLLMRDQSMCCFGTVPKINEWVSVKTIGKGVKPVMDEPVTIFGKLHVGEMRENGYLVGIYSMDGERLAGPLDL